MHRPTKEQETELEIKRSKFFSYAVPVSGEPEVKDRIAREWKDHPRASHIVWAFVLGPRADIFGMSDDHEPKNTAGRPTLEVLKGSGLTDILVMTVRYFGGTKLGTGGLVRAYTEAAQLVLKDIPSEQLITRKNFEITIGYELYQSIHSILISCEADQLQENFETAVTISGRIPEHTVERASAEIQERSAGACRIIYR